MSSAEPGVPAVRVDEALYVLAREYKRTYLLLDCFGGNPLAEDIAAAEAPAAASLPLDDPMFEDDLDSAPLLIEILHDQPAHQPLLARSIELAQYQALNGGTRSVCAWLFSDVALTRLRGALRQRLDARYPDGRIYFRYFDPRVMGRLAQVLAPGNSGDTTLGEDSSFSDVLGPVTSWCQLDRNGAFQRFDNPMPGTESARGRMRFGADSAAAIERIAAVNLTASALRESSYNCEHARDPHIDGYLVQAQELGLAKMPDQVAYARRAIQYGAGFTGHVALPGLLADARQYGVPLDVLLQEHLTVLGH